jgi:hypothetical protein
MSWFTKAVVGWPYLVALASLIATVIGGDTSWHAVRAVAGETAIAVACEIYWRWATRRAGR